MPEGKAIIFSAPSGAGKTTIVKHLLKLGMGLRFSVSATSREKRPLEVQGRDYYFLTPEEFDKKIRNGEFIEWEEVYSGTKYGTLKTEVERVWKNKGHVLFDVDVVGGLNLKQYFGSNALAVFVLPPSISALRERLEKRGTESAENMQKRIEKAEKELQSVNEFDAVLLNDNLQKALGEAEKLVKGFLNQKT